MATPSVSRIQVDDSLWPLLVVRYEGTPTLAQLQHCFALREEALARQEHHVMLHDLRLSSGINPPEHRRLQRAWLQAHDALIRRWSLGAALVIDSAFVRLMMSVILHVNAAPSPHVVVATPAQGATWLAGRLSQAGLETEAHHIRAHFLAA